MMSGARKRICAAKGAVMRRLLILLGLLVPMSDASAGEFELPTLRGSQDFAPPPVVRTQGWGGVYVGGQIGYGNANVDFATSTQTLVAHMLRELALEDQVQPSNWQVLGRVQNGSMNYGGFVGYNNRWEDLILGFEFNYNRTSFSATAPMSPLTRLTSAGGNNYLLTIDGSASMRVTDYATARWRAGWELGNFLPYGMIGFAVGRADITRTANAYGQENPAAVCPSAGPPPCTPFSFTESDSKLGAFIWGWQVGGGVDMMVMPKVFLRAELEYIGFMPVQDIKVGIVSARAGLGVKF
jgi:opacity protein-like surface antigen